jgi:methionyl-tRNA formyltransferase
MRLVFMGTPDFAVTSMKALLNSSEEIVGVVTQPDRPRGRGMKLSPSPVKALAMEHGIPVYQPEKAWDNEFLQVMRELSPDILVVVAYGQILKEPLLKLPPYGAINVHASLLPKYRGAAPIQRVIMAGEKETGVTIMQMDKGMDTGDILCQAKVRIEDEDTSGTLHDKLSSVGANTLIKTLKGIGEGTIRPIPQDHHQATYAPKISKEEGHINWEDSAYAIWNLVRALNPVPGAYTYHGELLLKIWSLSKIHMEVPETALPGEVMVVDNTKGIYVATGDGMVCIEEVQPEGRRRLHASEYIRGYRIEPGQVLDAKVRSEGGAS